MKFGLRMIALAGLAVTPMLAVDQTAQGDMHRIYTSDSRYEFRRSMERMRSELRREFSEIRQSAWRTRMDLQREHYRAQREVRQARVEAMRARIRARIETQREIRDLRRLDRRWF
jgi:hypothetical protein